MTKISYFESSTRESISFNVFNNYSYYIIHMYNVWTSTECTIVRLFVFYNPLQSDVILNGKLPHNDPWNKMS